MTLPDDRRAEAQPSTGGLNRAGQHDPDDRRAEAQPSTGGLDRAGKPNAADALFGILWTGLGLAIAIASWRMDRLEGQGVDPHSAPGLLPGMLGLLLAAFGLILALRRPPPTADAPATDGGVAEPWRIGLALLLTLGFGLGLFGRGPPFWLAAFLFAFLAILLFELPDRRRDGTVARGAARAALVAGLGSAAVTFVFQEVFLVRLP